MSYESETRLRKLVALLLKAGGTATIDGEGQHDPILRLGEKTVRLDPTLLAQSVSRGFLTRQGQIVQVRPEARSFLRRSLSEQEERRFAAQHGADVNADVVIEGQHQTVLRNALDSPLSQLARLKDRNGTRFLPAEALAAGEQLASDFQRAHLQPSITMRWEPRLSQPVKGGQGGKVDLSESAMAARDRVSHAVEAMGPELSGVALDVCCFAKGLEVVERERGWPARSAKLMLRTALLALARHYAPPVAGRRQHHWGDEGFRPNLS